MAQKIVVTGDINGQLNQFFTKLSTLQARQQFAFAIIAGNLFADPENISAQEAEELAKLVKGEIEVPVTTYFSIGHRALPSIVIEKLQSNDGELCTNLIALGRKGRVKTSEGFNIVAIGGKHQSGDEPANAYDASYSDKDANTAKGYNDADILITSEWPAGVADGSKAPPTSPAPASSESLSDLCTALKPRYHFSSSPAFWEREPFFHATDPPRPITRFLSLAPFGNPSKSKWIYAFTLEPSAEPPQHLPPDTTASPFLQTRKRKALSSQQDSYNALRFSTDDNPRSHGGGRGRGKRHKAGPPDPAECYFCLSNPQCESHMIASIGEESYLTTAKGPLPLPNTFPALGGALPGHVLIIPVSHVPTLDALEDSASRERVRAEMQKYRASLHAMLRARGDGSLGAVTWEIARAGGVHAHWQLLPVPSDLVSKGLVEAGFRVEAENASYPTSFLTERSEVAAAEAEGDYFKVRMWSAEGGEREMVLPLDATFRFDLQFGRRVLGKLLGLEKRAHWKDCGQSRAEEERECEVLKGMFAEFDFTAA